MKFKMLSLVMLLCICMSLIQFKASAYYAYSYVDAESNNSFSQAQTISYGSDKICSVVGYIGNSSDEDCYFMWLEEGYHTITLTNNNYTSISVAQMFGSLPGDYDVFVYNSSGTKIASGEASGNSWEAFQFSISAGNYYIKVKGYNGACSTSQQYKMMVTKGDAKFFIEAQKYANLRMEFYGQENNGYEYHSMGVAYGFGTKDEVSYYVDKLNEANRYKSSQGNWGRYADGHPKPGRYGSDYQSQTGWCGVDCSGFIWWAALYSNLNYKINENSVMNVGTVQIASNAVTNLYSSIGSYYLHVGPALFVKSGVHVASISRYAYAKNDMGILHAAGSNNNRVAREEALISGLSSNASGYNMHELKKNN